MDEGAISDALFDADATGTDGIWDDGATETTWATTDEDGTTKGAATEEEAIIALTLALRSWTTLVSPLSPETIASIFEDTVVSWRV